MKEEPLSIVDPTVRIKDAAMEERLRQISADRLKAAEEREIVLLNKPCLLDIFVDMAEKIHTFAKQKIKTR